MSMNKTGSRQNGVTLIELLIVVVVLSIILSIAVPSYRDYVLRTNRTVARAVLLEVSAKQEQFFADNKRYTADLSELGYSGATFGMDSSHNDVTAGSSNQIYLVSSTISGGAVVFTLTADTKNNQEKDDGNCKEFTLKSNGKREVTGSLGDTCWKR